MRIVLWDTRKLDVSKDFAGGMGIGMFPDAPGLRAKLVRYFYTRDYRPVALLYAYLTAIFRKLGHQVEYCLDRLPADADLYVFNPSLITLHLERQAMDEALARNPKARVLVVGTVATVLPQAFQGRGITVVKGEAEQLLWKFDEVLARPDAAVQLGSIEDLDTLPMPDWSPFEPHRFKIGYDFWRFPTGLVQSSRGCTMKCNYCPYIVIENSTRHRSPEAVVEEMRYGMRRWAFRSFKFRDPLFGLSRKNVLELVELLGRLPRKVQFSIETRIDLMRPEILKALKDVGLTSITVGVETPDETTLRRYRRAPIKDDRQREFIATCRAMNIRTVAGFMIGFPEDTVESIHAVADYAKMVGPTYANINIVTPYPGTEFFNLVQDEVADRDYSHYTVFTPVMKYKHLTSEQVSQLHQWCARRYYFRWQYLKENAHLIWPWLQRFGLGARHTPTPQAESAHPAPPRPMGNNLVQIQEKTIRKDSPHGPS